MAIDFKQMNKGFRPIKSKKEADNSTCQLLLKY